MTSHSPAPHYDPTAQYEVRSQDLEYLHDGQRSWLASIFRPQGNGPFPMLIEIHGGAWTQMDRTQNAEIDESLASHGLVVAAIDFHLGGQAPHPAAQQDINYAIRWLKAHAADFNATPSGFGGLGFSSGGHQIMLNAMRARDPVYSAISLAARSDLDASLAYVMMGWPVIDPYARFTYSRDLGRQQLVDAGLLYFGDEATMQDANPQQIVNRGEPAQLPPALMVHGAADDIVPLSMAEDFVSAYARAGGLIELAKYPGERHRFMSEPGANTTRALEAMKYFMCRQLANLSLESAPA